MSTICECGKVDWSGGPGNYIYIETGKPYKQGDNISCQDKINNGMMTDENYDKICQYIPGAINSKFPKDVYEKLYNGEY
tara:strand:+ start:253 stop:489 length:237 start_codon:yes stop_codon:yes gene_type:complete